MVLDWHSGAGCQKISGESKDRHDSFILFRNSSVEGGASPLQTGIFIFIPADGQ
jgi:hypothetical protein